MSQLEERAKPTITSLILGNKTHLTPSNAALITRWITLKAMIIDSMRENNQDGAFTRSEIEHFYTSNSQEKGRTFESKLTDIPHNIEIAIFHCGHGKWTNSIGIDQSRISNVRGYKPERDNVKIIAWGIGNLFVTITYRELVRFPLPVIDNSEIEIWPLVTSEFWPRERRISEEEATSIAEALSIMEHWPQSSDQSGQETSYGPIEWRTFHRRNTAEPNERPMLLENQSFCDFTKWKLPLFLGTYELYCSLVANGTLEEFMSCSQLYIFNRPPKH